jgi:hypothetical protein
MQDRLDKQIESGSHGENDWVIVQYPVEAREEGKKKSGAGKKETRGREVG